MFGIFKKKSEKDILYKQYEKLIKECHKLTSYNRLEADKKFAEAQDILIKLESLAAK